MIRKNYKPLIWSLTIAINGLIVLSFLAPRVFTGHDFRHLPFLNAILNGFTFISLLAALFTIRRQNIRRHRQFIFLSFALTSIFLLSYLTYHFTTPSTRYGGVSSLRYVYYFILLTHIGLAALIVPMAMYTMSLALNEDTDRHKKVAKWIMPVWLYVSFTGVIVYWMIAPFYRL